jgi:hypothetical protein
MVFMYLPKNVWCCIITNEAYVVYYIFLTEDAPICGETRLRWTLKKVNKSCWWFYTFDLKTLHGWKVWRYRNCPHGTRTLDILLEFWQLWNLLIVSGPKHAKFGADCYILSQAVSKHTYTHTHVSVFYVGCYLVSWDERMSDHYVTVNW